VNGDHANFMRTHQCGGYKIHNEVHAADMKEGENSVQIKRNPFY
jgi:hypothetical protein